MTVRRGTSNSNSRGSAAARRTRKQWVLDVYGDGTYAMCSFGCGALLDITSVTMDRYPVPGCMGGRYVRGNIRPACLSCNAKYGAPLSRKKSKMQEFYTPAEVAKLFRVDRKTVTRWAQKGKLSSITTLGGHRRYPVAEVDAHLARGTISAFAREAIERHELARTLEQQAQILRQA